MNVLWFAFGIYILGISAVLFLRPSLMFDGGSWKEFGLSQKGNYTLFPFWMFIVLWSVFSYVLGSFCVVGFSSVSTNSNISLTAPASPASSAGEEVKEEEPLQEASKETNTEEPTMVINEINNQTTTNKSLDFVEEDAAPKRQRRWKKKPVPGYYVRGVVKGKPKYVYYGTESPFDG